MFQKNLICLFVIPFFFLVTVQVYGHGTAVNTKITNANVVGTPNFVTATNPGNVAGRFTNATGAVSFALVQATSATTWVTAGYDMSLLRMTTYTQYGGAGATVDFAFTLTNWGNLMDAITVKVTNKGATGAWNVANSYEVLTNTGIASIFGVSQQYTTPNLPADSLMNFIVRVQIPVAQAVGDTNRFIIRVNDGSPGGDVWPPAGALLPATPDVGNARDNQLINCYVKVLGPSVRLTKTVNLTSVRPYQILQYTIHYTNMGSASALGLVIRDSIPVTVQTMGGTLQISVNGGGFNNMSDAADGDDAEWVGNRVFFRPNAGTVAANGYGDLRFQVKVK